MEKETIVAIATPISQGGISIIRISGPDAVLVADNMICSRSGKRFVSSMESHTVRYGFVRDLSDSSASDISFLDEVLVVYLQAPKSFTAEDTVEIHCHGGILVTQKILSCAVQAGARLAEPGEFTKRAFLNGRIDLSEAEAVMDLISSQNELALKSSVFQLQGRLSEQIRKMRADILYETARIESAIDDPEHFSLEDDPERLEKTVRDVLHQTEKLIDTFGRGRYIREGIRTVILGKPNTGKSSVLNLLVGSDRAIVTDIAGTTRDTLEETAKVGEVLLHLIDTAGLHETDDPVEKIGVERAKKALETADLILLVIDGSEFLSMEDMMLFPLAMAPNASCIVLRNKSDRGCQIPDQEFYEHMKFMLQASENASGETEDLSKRFPILSFSAKTGEGMDVLEKKLTDHFLEGTLKQSDEPMITNLRHLQALEAAADSLRNVLKSVEDGMQEDFYSIDLMGAYRELGKILGEEVEEDLVNEIFSKFCMGK